MPEHALQPLPFSDQNIHPDLCLRRLNPADLGDFQAYRRDATLARYQGWEVVDDRQALDFIETHHAGPLLAPGEWCQLGIAALSEDRVIGDIGLCLAEDLSSCEVGYTVNGRYHRQGVGSAAVRLAAKWVFASSPAQRLVAMTDVRNAASIALLTSTGFARCGELTSSPGSGEAIEWIYDLHRADVL